MIKIASIPFHPAIGDIKKNADRLLALLIKEKSKQTDLVIFPELSLSGYYGRDLYYQHDFMIAHEREKNKIIKESKIKKLPAFIMGVATIRNKRSYQGGFSRDENNGIYNSYLFIDKGKVIAERHKYNLPNYDIFVEPRYFIKGEKDNSVITWRKMKWAVMICEELWQDDIVIKQKPDLIIAINASPYEKNKWQRREQQIKKWAKKIHAPIVYNNMLASFDGNVLDGHHIIADNRGKIITEQAFASNPLYFNLDGKEIIAEKKYRLDHKNTMAQYYSAIDLALTDYMSYNGFDKVILGLSGGIDSSLSLALAVDILGADKVMGFYLPTNYSSDDSEKFVKELCQNFSLSFETINIESAYRLLLDTIKMDEWADDKKSVTIPAQNIQSRIRGMVLMAKSNLTGGLLLATGNKSELAVGYSTLYGDSCGGFNLLKDLYKKDVYKLAQWFNQNRASKIPEGIITRPPTAELSPNQTDQDSLPPYDILDGVLEKLIENFGRGKPQPEPIIEMLWRAEFKRRQSAPGPKLSTRAFNDGWLMPIAIPKKL